MTRMPPSILAALSILSAGAAVGSARAAYAPTGKMAPFTYLLGAAWNCTTSVPAMGTMPAHTDQGTATFEVAPGNAIHNHVATPNYWGDFYFGYSDKVGTFWQVDADNMGSHAFLTSSDGATYSGTSSMGTVSLQDTVTYTKVSESKVTVHEVLSGQGPFPGGTFDSVCTR
jgi:hypothetical protein